jgi:hypothetical protein
MKLTPLLAMHWRAGGRGGLILLVVAMAICALIIAWPNKNENK